MRVLDGDKARVVGAGGLASIGLASAVAAVTWDRLEGLALAVAALGMAAALYLALRPRRHDLQVAELTAALREINESGDHSTRLQRSEEPGVAALTDQLNALLETVRARELERDQALLRTREKSQFLAAMSHELRTPLNSVIGFAEILLARADDHLDVRQRKYLDNIYRSGQHLLGVINDILDLSKVEAGKIEFFPEPVSVLAIIESVVAVMTGAADKAQVEVRIETTGELPVVVADAVQIKQVLFNLLSNAIKFSPEHSVVRISAAAIPGETSPIGEDAVEIAVADHGIGISDEDREKIFQPFRQADSGVARRFQGAGLGLSLARSYVLRHGGVILLDSEVGQGSTFTVVLPRRIAGAVGGAERAVEAGARILVVGGNRSTQDRIRLDLTAGGFEVMSAGGSREALELVQQFAPAAVVVDLMLPGAEGWEALTELKVYRKTAGAPVVLCSPGDGRSMDLVVGVDDFFVKPLGIGRLVARIQQIVQTRSGVRSRILLIDDDPAVHEELQSRLVEEGYRVDHAQTAELGIARASANPPSLVVLDPRLGGWEGVRAAVRLRSLAKTARMPVIGLTALELSDQDRGLLDDRVAELVGEVEPDRQTLVDTVRMLLARRRD